MSKKTLYENLDLRNDDDKACVKTIYVKKLN